MKRTDEGYFDGDKVKKVYAQLKENLNSHELAMITDSLVWDKHIFMKTVLLAGQDLEKV